MSVKLEVSVQCTTFIIPCLSGWFHLQVLSFSLSLLTQPQILGSFCVPRMGTLWERSIQYTGPVILNSLPSSLSLSGICLHS